MTAENILQSDVLDILFEDRNKLYGAYELRRTYPKRVKRAIIGMFTLVALASAGYLFGSGKNTDQNGMIDVFDTTKLTLISDPIEKPKEKETAPPKAATPKDVAMVKDFIPQILPDVEVPETEVPDVQQVDTSAYGNKTQTGEGVAGEMIQSGNGTGEEGTENGTGKQAIATEPVLPPGPIDMGMADELPEYPGGKMALVRYMVNNLTSELEPGVKYVVRAQFVINEEGKVSEAMVLSSDDATLNPQVLRALNKMKIWKPGSMKGRKVAVRFTMPITFVGPEA